MMILVGRRYRPFGCKSTPSSNIRNDPARAAVHLQRQVMRTKLRQSSSSELGPTRFRRRECNGAVDDGEAGNRRPPSFNRSRAAK